MTTARDDLAALKTALRKTPAPAENAKAPAMALAMESPMLPGDTNFALSGGVGYYEDQGAGTLAITARVSENAAFSAGVGVGFDSGEIGARGGFQVAW